MLFCRVFPVFTMCEIGPFAIYECQYVVCLYVCVCVCVCVCCMCLWVHVFVCVCACVCVCVCMYLCVWLSGFYVCG